MKFSAGLMSEKGPRTENEDGVLACEVHSGALLIAVADGLGGHAGGKFASSFALDRFRNAVSLENVSSLTSTARDIHVQLKSQQIANPQYSTMATTLSAAILSEEGMHFVHCGDSRIVVARGEGIRRITRDHSEAQRLFAAGKLSREELASYPRKNILESALGITGNPIIDEGHFRLLPNDKIFISTDGFHNKILIRELFSFAQLSANPQELIELAGKEMKNRAADDNYSLVCAFASE
jgi:serine/threonine protein phosphatase PrpC